MSEPERDVERAVRAALVSAPSRVVLAVSGGMDSMTLLDVAARVAADRVAAVATFDHGTGLAATAAAALVVESARERGIPCVAARADVAARDEAGWRDARWRFLRAAASERGAAVATAHTRDDQLETVVARVLRGAGARGLAAMRARSAVVRPLLGVARADVRRLAEASGVQWLDDPSNASRRHLRNRVRHDLLPALLRARPALGDELLALAERAAAWRAEVEALARRVAVVDGDGAVRVAVATVASLDAAGRAVLWPAIAALAGATLDRRATDRLASFTGHARGGSFVQLAAGFVVERRRSWFVLRRVPVDIATSEDAVPLADGVEISGLRLAAVEGEPDGRWVAELPSDRGLRVRPWRAGDRMRHPTLGTARRVKRYLSDVGLGGSERRGWPVVVAGDEIIWIPGVCRAAAATVRPGRPGVRYACERISSHR